MECLYRADENKVYGSILVTDGNTTNIVEVYRLALPSLLLNDVVVMTAGCEIRNDAEYNVEFVDQLLLSQTIPALTEYNPPGSICIGSLSGTDVGPAGQMHYFRPNRTEIFKMPCDMAQPLLMYRVRCRSDVAKLHGSRYCTIMAPGYGRISAVILRP